MLGSTFSFSHKLSILAMVAAPMIGLTAQATPLRAQSLQEMGIVMSSRLLFVCVALSTTCYVFTSPASAVTIDWVTVGGAGNAPDTEVMFCCGTSVGITGFGSVADAYRILAETTRIVKRIEDVSAASAISRADFYRIMTEMGRVVHLAVEDPAVREKIHDGWMEIRLA